MIQKQEKEKPLPLKIEGQGSWCAEGTFLCLEFEKYYLWEILQKTAPALDYRERACSVWVDFFNIVKSYTIYYF